MEHWGNFCIVLFKNNNNSIVFRIIVIYNPSDNADMSNEKRF